jgi:alpha-2-macroglobulin
MQYYSYICLEQSLSRAVALRDETLWKDVMQRLPNYLDRDGLARYFPSEWLQGSDTLSSYVLAIAQEAGWEIPAATLQTMQAGLRKFIAGEVVRDSALPTTDLALRKLAAISALARYGAADAAMLGSITLEPTLWPTSGLLDWVDILQRVPNIDDVDNKRANASNLVRARLNFQGTVMGFATERSDALWWLMISGDVNAARAVLAFLNDSSWHEDIPRMVRGALARQAHGHWNTTNANAWGVLAMEKFSKAFEATPVTGQTTLDFGAAKTSVEWPANEDRSSLEFPWGDAPAKLQVKHKGTGKPWAMIASRAALPLDGPLFTGYSIERVVTPIEQKTPGVWTRGDVARITLNIDAQSDSGWVVVDDPIPAGASVLGTGLGRDAGLLTQGEKREGWVYPAYEERRFDAFRAYYTFVPKGRFTVEYTVRLNNPGNFVLPATRVEAMYAPEMFAELPNAALEVNAP